MVEMAECGREERAELSKRSGGTEVDLGVSNMVRVWGEGDSKESGDHHQREREREDVKESIW